MAGDRRDEVRPDDVRRSASGRVPQWVVDEAHGQGVDPPSWRAARALDVQFASPATACPPPPTRSRSLVAVVVAIVITIGFVAVSVWEQRSQAETRAEMLRPSNWPPAVHTSPVPLGTPAALTTTNDSYAFTTMGPDGVTPVGFDPCRPVHYVVNDQRQPIGGEAMLRSAIGDISAATGLVFIDDGTTDEPYTRDRALFQPERYGDRWVPVLIVWGTPETAPKLAGTTAGFAGGNSVAVDGQKTFVSGSVVLDAPAIADMISAEGNWSVATSIMRHELGHLVGLDHVAQPDQLMYESVRDDVTGFAAGDRTGLSRLGSLACTPGI